MLTEHITVSKVIVKYDCHGKQEAQSNQIYLKLLWVPNENDILHMKLFDVKDSWSGCFSKDSDSKYKDKHLTLNDVEIMNMKDALSGVNEVYSYDIIKDPNDENAATFRWKKNWFPGVEVLGSIPILRDKDYVSKDTLIDILLKSNRDLQHEIGECTKVTSNLEREIGNYKDDLEKLLGEKLELEATLYEKFVKLINSKKRRIELLEEKIEQTK